MMLSIVGLVEEKKDSFCLVKMDRSLVEHLSCICGSHPQQYRRADVRSAAKNGIP